MEVSFSVQLGVDKEVGESSLLNELVLFVDSIVLDLLLSVSEVLVLDHLDGVSPLVSKLGELVSGVGVVEDGELWTDEVGEVSNLNETNVVGNEELMMPDHGSKPVIIFPTAKSGDGVNRSNVGSEEDETSSGSGESLVMWGDLLWTNSLEQSLHEVQVGHENWRSFSVVWMDISNLHVCKTGFIVIVGAVLSLVLWFDNFLLHLGHVLNLGFVCVLKLGFHVISNRKLSALSVELL